MPFGADRIPWGSPLELRRRHAYGTWSLTTVGYGDMFPVTAKERFFTFVVLLLGLGGVAVPTGLVASALSKAREEE